MYRTVKCKKSQPICSTNSLAVASLFLAVSAVVVGLSPILHPAFLPISLLGMVLAVLGLFMCHDRNGLQVGALAVNGFVMLLALLMGPRMSAAATSEDMTGGWGAMIAADDDRLQGKLLDRQWKTIGDGSTRLELSIAWTADDLSGCWNWIDGVMQLSHLDGDEILELDWRISGTVTSAGTLVRSDEFIFDETNDAHRWLTATANSRIKVRFIPTQWEHAALDRSLRPAPIMMARPGARLAGSQ